MSTRKSRKTSPTRKPARAKEYTGPNTLEDVKHFLQSNATQKAKVKAMEALSGEDQVAIMKWVQEYTLDAIEHFQRTTDAEWKRRGYDLPPRTKG